MGLGTWARNEWTEAKEAGREVVHFLRHHNWKKSARESVRRKYWVWWLVGAIVTAALVLLSIYRDTIIEKFEPHKQDIRDFPASWVIPIVVLVVLSVPPLGGGEVVLMVVGLIWGVGLGFAIAAAGTFIGEVLCFWGFKYLFTNKAAQIETKSIWYACIARLMRHGGLYIIIIVRFSAVPGHVVTAIQSTVGMSLWIYSIAIIVSLPKQLAVVYLGYMFGVNHDTASPAKVREQKIISLSVLFATGIATVVSLYIVYMRARKLYPEVLRDMDEAQVGAKSPLALEAGAGAGAARPGGRAGAGAPLERRHSLVEAAFEGEPGVPERSYRTHARGHAHGHGHSAWLEHEHEHDGDDWDSKSPALRGGASAGGTPRAGAAAWQDGRAERHVPVPALGYAYGERDPDPALSYAHLPLASEGDVGAGAGAGARGGAYEDPFEGPEDREDGFAGVGAGGEGPGGRYGALGRSR